MARTTQSYQVGTYKGRKYRVLWSGPTKYGQRAHLQFFDGSRDFWVDAAAVTICPPRQRDGEDDGVCAECGRGGHLVADLEDGLLKHYNCCDIPPG